jgi:4a-hydroxytetrahydrobiopterin dehydratase
MPNPPLLDADAVREALRGLDGWDREGDALTKTFRFHDFAAAVRFIDSLVPVADGMDHHPDVGIHWDSVRLSLWTHVSGGITERDVRLAHAIEAL